MPNDEITLTGNDIALAMQASGIATAWYKDRPKCEWNNERMADLRKLIVKLSSILDAAYPHVTYDEHNGFNVDEHGGEVIMSADARGIAETRKLGLDA